MFSFSVQTLPSGVLLVSLTGKVCKCEAANELRDAPVVIARPHDLVKKVLNQVQLDLLFDIVDDLDKAIAPASG